MDTLISLLQSVTLESFLVQNHAAALSTLSYSLSYLFCTAGVAGADGEPLFVGRNNLQRRDHVPDHHYPSVMLPQLLRVEDPYPRAIYYTCLDNWAFQQGVRSETNSTKRIFENANCQLCTGIAGALSPITRIVGFSSFSIFVFLQSRREVAFCFLCKIRPVLARLPSFACTPCTNGIGTYDPQRLKCIIA